MFSKKKCILMSTVLWLSLVWSGSVMASEKSVTISAWAWHPSAEVGNMVAEAFAARYPNIKLEYVHRGYTDHITALKPAFAAGAPPEAVELEVGSMTAVYSAWLEPLNDWAEKAWGTNWRDKFVDIGLEQALLADKAHETFYCLPISVQNAQIWYNHKLFKECGIAGPPTTYVELKKIVEKLRAGGVVPLVIGAKDGWPNVDVYLQLADQTAPSIFYQAETGKISFTDPGLVKAMQVWADMFLKDKLFQEGAFAMTQYPEAVAMFYANKAAMIPLGSWTLEEFTRYPDAATDWGIFRFPSLEPGTPVSRPVGGVDAAWGLSPLASGEKKEAAWKFIQFYTAEEGQRIYTDHLCDLSAQKGFAPRIKLPENAQTVFKQFVDDMNYAIRRQLLYPEIREALMEALTDAGLGTKTAFEAMTHVESVSRKVKR